MTLVSSVWREVTQKLGLLKALIGFCTIAGEESKRKAEPRTRSASRLSLKIRAAKTWGFRAGSKDRLIIKKAPGARRVQAQPKKPRR